MSAGTSGRRPAVVAAWIALAIALAVSLALVLTPVFVIMPFKAQTPDGVRLSYHLRAFSPTLTLVLLAAGAGVLMWLWRRTRPRWLKAVAAVLVGILAGSAWLARQNHFEWMFHPLHEVAFTDARGAHGVAEDDLVLGVAAGEEASAYPVRALAYHHVVNDTVGERAVVVTY